MSHPPPDNIPFREALAFWLKLGFISFGGPAGQIAILHAELVEKRRWISEARFLHALNYCMLLPGPEAQQLATYLGWLMHRTRGGIVAGALFVLPSLVILTLLSWVYVSFGQLPAIAAIFAGIKPAVAAIVLHAATRMGQRTLKHTPHRMIAVSAFIAIAAFQAPFPLIILLAGTTGWLTRSTLNAAQGHQAGIDDTTAPAPHTRFSPKRCVIVIATGVLLWLLTIGLLVALNGADGTLTHMGWFFTKAALLTFGGAYAVLPYVWQGAVDHYQWLTAGQMLDGLALGESTPGPLIMVVAFAGFLGGHAQMALGDGVSAVASGVAAAVLVTWVTFLPSFIFILAGAPFVESTRNRLNFTAPLGAISAAVVGVIAHLALFLIVHVGWPAGMDGAFDEKAAVLFAAAALALFRFKVGIMPLLGVSALTGWALSLL